MKQLRQEPVNLRQTDNVQWQWIDSASGDLIAEGCDGAMYIPLLRQTVPRRATFAVNLIMKLNQPICLIVNIRK